MDMLMEKARDYAREVFAGDASGHDFQHTLRVLQLAERIAEAEGASPDVVRLAALLHDVDDGKLSPDTARTKARADAFLRDNGVEDSVREHILTILRQISFSTGHVVPDSLEGKCVQDADRLDALGAIGIARTFAFGGSRGRLIHDPSGQDTTTSTAHFHEKLLKLRSLMNTAEGRRLAGQRHEYMLRFLEEFHAEWQGLR